jgi:hypothetical protein
VPGRPVPVTVSDLTSTKFTELENRFKLPEPEAAVRAGPGPAAPGLSDVRAQNRRPWPGPWDDLWKEFVERMALQFAPNH